MKAKDIDLKVVSDFRSFLAELEKCGLITKFNDEVDWDLEAGAIMRYCDENQLPAQWFMRIKDAMPGSSLVGGLYADMVDGWCGDLPVTINLAEGIVDAAVPAYVHSGPGNCLGPVPPVRLTLYMRDASVLVIGWRLESGGDIQAQGLVSEEPTAVCVVVPYDWELHLWTEEDIMERPDRFAQDGPAMTAADWIPAPNLAVSIDIPVVPNTEYRTGVPNWWHGPEPECPELPDPSPSP